MKIAAIRLALCALLLLGGLPLAKAQTFTTAGGGIVTGQVPLCLDANNVATPCGQPVTGHATGSTGAVAGSLAAVSGKLNLICGFDVSAIGGTATVGPITLTGIVGGTFTYQLGSLASGNTMGRQFWPCIPATGQNVAITVTTTADGTATGVDVNLWGLQQ